LKATKATKGGGAGSNQPDGVYIARPDVADELPSEICIMMDPNRRDLLYYMHERDSRANKLEERFTSNNLSLECHRWLKENSMIKKTWAIVWSFLSGLPVFKASLWRLLET
jgi:hypothetical protein